MAADPVRPIDTAGIAALIAARVVAGRTLLVGITGSVAVGKSTLVANLVKSLAASHRVDQFCTDGFLLPNHILGARGLTLRKGFPESYDRAALVTTLDELRHGPALVPGYSHLVYDVDPALARQVGPAELILVEGLGLAHAAEVPLPIDLTVYIDADEADIERWFVARFMTHWHAAAADSTSFYARFRGFSEADAAIFAASVWTNINLPNLRDHIGPARAVADIILHKAGDHSLSLVRPTSQPARAR